MQIKTFNYGWLIVFRSHLPLTVSFFLHFLSFNLPSSCLFFCSSVSFLSMDLNSSGLAVRPETVSCEHENFPSFTMMGRQNISWLTQLIVHSHEGLLHRLSISSFLCIQLLIFIKSFVFPISSSPVSLAVRKRPHTVECTHSVRMPQLCSL